MCKVGIRVPVNPVNDENEVPTLPLVVLGGNVVVDVDLPPCFEASHSTLQIHFQHTGAVFPSHASPHRMITVLFPFLRRRS